MPTTTNEYGTRGRAAKVSAMVATIDQARRLHDPSPTWLQTADRLDRYTPDEWRTLSVAAGRADRVPSADTQHAVRAAVRTLAIAQELDPFRGLPDA